MATINLRASDVEVTSTSSTELFNTKNDPYCKPIQQEVVIKHNGYELRGIITDMNITVERPVERYANFGRSAHLPGRATQRATFSMILSKISNS